MSLKIGHRVQIRPQGRADVMDLALEGKIAVIESIVEEVSYVTVSAIVPAKLASFVGPGTPPVQFAASVQSPLVVAVQVSAIPILNPSAQ